MLRYDDAIPFTEHILITESCPIWSVKVMGSFLTRGRLGCHSPVRKLDPKQLRMENYSTESIMNRAGRRVPFHHITVNKGTAYPVRSFQRLREATDHCDYFLTRRWEDSSRTGIHELEEKKLIMKVLWLKRTIW